MYVISLGIDPIFFAMLYRLSCRINHSFETEAKLNHLSRSEFVIIV